tara:strand:- start:71 stop:349 length:279 start_codon:yes stop_codon:yes gene_type:complete
MTKFVLILYLCSQLSGQCPSHHYPGVSFETHTACVEYGYRAAYGTFNQLEKVEDFTKEYIENSRIAVRFECRAVEVKPEIVPPPPKPKGKAT